MLGDAVTAFLDLILPPRESERLMRSLTLEKLERLIKENEGVLPYQDPKIKALVWELKYHKNSHAISLAGEVLSEQLLAVRSETLGKPLLIPVPMHPTRRRERGHNQTELLCEAALKILADPNLFEYVPNVLERIHNTAPQQGLPRYVRLHNIEGSMQVVEPKQVHGRECVVVDDVSTTGATLKEALRVLLKAGARAVHNVFLAQS